MKCTLLLKCKSAQRHKLILFNRVFIYDHTQDILNGEIESC